MLSINLPPVDFTHKLSFFKALSSRHSCREFLPDDLPEQELSNLLWATDGINRPGTDMRTAASAMNMREATLFVVMRQGVYRYDPDNLILHPVKEGDWRVDTGSQPFVPTAPVQVVVVSDYIKMEPARLAICQRWGLPPDEKDRSVAKIYAHALLNAGHRSQNAYLYCAYAGLGMVTRASFDQDNVKALLELGPNHLVTLIFTVGYPA